MKLMKRHSTGRASDYLHHAEVYYRQHPDMQAVIYIRESGRKARQTRNHINHKRVQRDWLEKQNIPILVEPFFEVISGRDLSSNRKAFLQAVEFARKNNAVIITTCANRYLRNANMQSDIPPTQHEFETLLELADGVPLLTLLHPDLPPSRVRSKLTKLGQRIKCNKGGRPPKKRAGYKNKQRETFLPVALQYYYSGKCISEIARLIGVPRSTVDRWIKKHTII